MEDFHQNETDTHIHSPELAEAMAYAEKPFRDLAQFALEVNLPDHYDRLIRWGDEDARKAGRTYVAEASLNLQLNEAEANREALKVPHVITTQDSLIEYAYKTSHPEKNKGLMTMTWNALRSSHGKRLVEEYPDYFVTQLDSYDRQELVTVYLTKAIVDDLLMVRNVGVACQALVRGYFEGGVSDDRSSERQA